AGRPGPEGGVTAGVDAPVASERAGVGAAISSTDLAVSVVERVQARDLQDRIHQTIYGVVAELVGRGSQVSPTIVLSELQKAGHLVGRLDSTYLFGLVEAAALPSRSEEHTSELQS